MLMKKSKRKFRFMNQRAFTVFFAVFFSLGAFAQQMTVSGLVFDATQQPLIGVSVLEKGTSNGAITDMDGHFSLKTKENSTLIFSYVGYKTQEKKASSHMSVTLQEDAEILDEVVVIGYGSVKRKDVTTAISSVSTKDIDQRPILSTGQAIQGKAAGVSVISPTGEPGGEMSIRVRGTTSMNGSNDPLYVVDGVPVDNLKFLAPTDIADMQILKDASSAAIYGSRGANGVILITTKAGAEGKTKVSFTAQFGLNKVVDKMQSLNSAQYKELQDEIGLISLPDGLPDVTNWFDETYTTGNTQNYQIAVTNGNDKMNYYLSLGYQKEKGILDISYYKRYNFRLNFENKIRSWITLGANISYADYSGNAGGAMGTGSNRGGVVLAVINTPTYAPIWNPLAPDQYYNNFYGIGNITSPLENMARAANNKDKENRLLATGNITLTFLPELKLKSSFTLDRRNGVNTTFLDPISTAWGRNQYGEGSDKRNVNTVLTFDNVLTYNKTFQEHHNMELMGGSSYTSSDYSNSWINGSHYRDALIQTLNAANKIAWDNTGTGGSQWRILSYFARASYNFDSKYLFTANMRADGSSKLHPDHRWGYFPSFSAAWRLSSEKFMKDITWIDDLKIRAGWGQTGNQSGIKDYAYLQNYTINRLDWTQAKYTNAVPNIEAANKRSENLTWETTTQTNVGLDLSLWNGRLIFNADYYYKRTKDMLMFIELPAQGGTVSTKMQRNEGEMTNKGFEFSLSSRNIQGDFSWNTDFNISFNRNKLTKLALKKVYTNAQTSDYIKEDVVRNEPGRSLGGFYGYISDGVNPETGELMYRDLNGDKKISTSDRAYIGDPNPDFVYGLTNTFSYKGFNLSVFVQGSYGNDIYNASRIETEGMYDGKNQSTRVLKRWKIPGQITDVPKAGFDLKNSSYFIEDGSYLRLKDVTLSYNFSGKLLRKWGITRLQPYFTATNLLTWTHYSGMDPEVNQWKNEGSVQGIDWGTYPHSKTYTMGINVEF